MKQPAITQHCWAEQARIVQPVIPSDKPRHRDKEQSFVYILKEQISNDPMTFILTRLAGLLIVINVINQIGIWWGW